MIASFADYSWVAAALATACIALFMRVHPLWAFACGAACPRRPGLIDFAHWSCMLSILRARFCPHGGFGYWSGAAMGARLEAMAQRMWQARQRRLPYRNLPDDLRPASIAEAYAAECEAEARHLLGWRSPPIAA